MKFRSLCFALLVLASATSVRGEPTEEQGPAHRPLWEIGLFNGAARLPHYRGSDEYEIYAIPLPFLIYRGEWFQSDREGIRGLLLRTDHFESSFSASGSPPVDDDNEARQDMPELDPFLEFGPALRWHVRGRQTPNPTYLSLALRGVLSIRDDSGVDFDYRGLHGVLKFVYFNRSLLQEYKMTLGFAAAADYGDRRFNNYLYAVPVEFMTPDRPAFETEDGYAGFSISANATKRISERFSAGIFCQWANIEGAVFENSPLVREENNFTVACALIWRIAQSERPAHQEGP